MSWQQANLICITHLTQWLSLMKAYSGKLLRVSI